MKLRFSPTSPYVRKVRASSIELGLEDRIELVATNPWDAGTDLRTDNPLGKVPALLLDDGTPLFDSPVICEYLDHLGGAPRLYPPVGRARWQALRLQAMADGILDACVLRFLERKRAPQMQSNEWQARQQAAVTGALDCMEQEVVSWSDAVTIGQIAAGCALGYIDFRFADDGWRAGRPRLTRWYEDFCQRPSMTQTVPRDPS